VGILIGIAGTLFLQKFTFNSTAKQVRKMEEDREKRDPANWWKYGGDPFPQEEDDEDMAK
jgi:hypothetical protein